MVESGVAFNPQSYWERRLRVHQGIQGVGDPGRSPRFLEHHYLARVRQVELILRHCGLVDLAGLAVLDIGSGTGIWLDFWHHQNASRVAGLDFTQASIEDLRVRFPGDQIVQADVSETPPGLFDTYRFDLISAFDILLHIVDPAAFRRAIANLASFCTPGGWLVISDAIVQGQGYLPKRTYEVHNRVRSLAEYQEVLTASGFVIDSVWPATVLLANPLEAPNCLAFLALSAWWKASRLWGRSHMLSSLLGPVVARLDHVACRLCSSSNAPTAKIIVARRKSDGVEGEQMNERN